MPAPGQEETVRIVALDRDFHVQCYRCEVCDRDDVGRLVCARPLQRERERVPLE